MYRCMAGVEMLEWDDWIGEHAQNWASAGIVKHSVGSDVKYKDGTGMGENLAVAGGDLAGVVKFWYEEIRYTGFNRVNSATGTDRYRSSIGHYTAEVWKGVQKLGCGWNHDQAQKFMGIPFSIRPFWVCQYMPGGNVAGQFLWKVIPPWRSYLDCPPSDPKLLVPGLPDPGRAVCFTKRSLVASQGGVISIKRGQSEEECKELCKHNGMCESFKLCGSTCTLYTGTISQFSPAAASQGTCHSYMLVKCFKCFRQRTLVADEGDATASPIEPYHSEEECSMKCALDGNCNSFAVCLNDGENKPGGGCWLKTKIVTLTDEAAPMTAEKYFRKCSTFYEVPKTQEEVNQHQCTSTTTTPDPTMGCPWLHHHWYQTTDPLCEDGKTAKRCVAYGHGPVLQCAAGKTLCAEQSCGWNRDYCCETDCSSKGGPLPCYGSRVWPPVPTPAPTRAACPWKSPQSVSGYAMCDDGAFSWNCVQEGRGQRIQCPTGHSVMCADLGCGSDGRDHCCQSNCDDKGGERPCPADVVPGPVGTPRAAPVGTPRAAPPPTAEPCPWKSPQAKSGYAVCADGKFSWNCVQGGHGQRIQCPKSNPVMCADLGCGADGRDHCCQSNCNDKGGEKPCPGDAAPHPAPKTCAWQTPNAHSMATCDDGAISWSCVKGGHGQRKQCTKEWPQMCADLGCGGGPDHCCDKNCDSRGGLRPCSTEPVSMSFSDVCIWEKPTRNLQPKCEDGSFSWSCVQGRHGQRIQCPLRKPQMCADFGCGADGKDHCCEESCDSKGGLRCGGLWEFVATQVLER